MVFKLKQKIANTITPVWLSFMTDLESGRRMYLYLFRQKSYD